jgi:hypothetical protein
LFGGLDGGTLEAGELGVAGLDDGALGDEGGPGGRADLGELVDHLVEAVALWGCGEDVDGGGDGVGAAWVIDGEEEGPVAASSFFDGGDGGAGEGALGVEEFDGVAGLEALHAGGVAGFVALDGDALSGGGGEGGEEDAVHLGCGGRTENRGSWGQAWYCDESGGGMHGLEGGEGRGEWRREAEGSI